VAIVRCTPSGCRLAGFEAGRSTACVRRRPPPSATALRLAPPLQRG